MYFENLFSVLTSLDQQTESISSRFHINKARLEKLRASFASADANRDAFLPQFVICGEENAGKTTLLKFIVNELSTDVLSLPSSAELHTNVPTVVTFTPQSAHISESSSHAYSIHYLTRDEYIEGALWAIENIVQSTKDDVQRTLRAAREQRTFDALKKACDAACDACGNDLLGVRKSLQKNRR